MNDLSERLRNDDDPDRPRFPVGAKVDLLAGCDRRLLTITRAEWWEGENTWAYEWEQFDYEGPQVLRGLVPLTREEWLRCGADQERRDILKSAEFVAGDLLGGHHNDRDLEIFRQGMATIINTIRARDRRKRGAG